MGYDWKSSKEALEEMIADMGIAAIVSYMAQICYSKAVTPIAGYGKHDNEMRSRALKKTAKALDTAMGEALNV